MGKIWRSLFTRVSRRMKLMARTSQTLSSPSSRLRKSGTEFQPGKEFSIRVHARYGPDVCIVNVEAEESGREHGLPAVEKHELRCCHMRPRGAWA